MPHFRFQLRLWICILSAVASQTACCQTPEPPVPPAIDRRMSPVDYFRRLLATKPEAREAILAGRSDYQKKILLAKLREYEQLPPDIRELRLRHTQLRWHLLDLMKMELQDRPRRLSQVAAEDLPLIEERLRRWDALNPEVRKVFLENERAVAMYLEKPPAPPQPPACSDFPNRQERLDQELVRWEALPAGQKQEMCDLFHEFFELGDKEKQQTLQKLPASQRQKTEVAMQAFAKLPPNQRDKRLESLRRLVSMNAIERQRFMGSAVQWRMMTIEEREIWRKSVAKLPPLPPMPPGLAEKLFPTPPMPPGFLTPLARTNGGQ